MYNNGKLYMKIEYFEAFGILKKLMEKFFAKKKIT